MCLSEKRIKLRKLRGISEIATGVGFAMTGVFVEMTLWRINSLAYVHWEERKRRGTLSVS